MLTLPYSPDHSGILQSLEHLKSIGRISDYMIADVSQRLKEGETAMVDCIVERKPDLVVHGMTDSLSQIWPPKIKERLPKTIQVMAMWDYRPQELQYDNLWGKWKHSAPGLDLITLSNKNQLEWWAKDFGVETMYWPHGCVVQDVEFDEAYAHNTIFVGGRNDSYPYNARVELIDSIARLTPIEWINYAGGDSTPERVKVWKDIGKIYGSAKTTLDISHFWDAEGYASGRYFYTSGLGACAITKRFPGCEELFPEGTKIYFDTPQEAVEKIKYYLEHEDARNEVKRKGKEWANKYHNYTVRFEQLFRKLRI